ncbi:MAG: adenosylcobinamide-phosphate synthase CbiB [Alphaproteobacteria bacterium]
MHSPHLLLLLGLMLDALVGEMPWLFRHVPHPVVVVGRSITILEARLNRPERSERDRRMRGLIVAVLLPVTAAALGLGIDRLASATSWAWGLELFLITTLLAQRSLFDHVEAVSRGLLQNGLAGGRLAVSRICGRDPDSLEEAGVARAAVESCAENFSDGVVAPAFWYLVLGLPGLLAYKTINTLDSMIGYRNARYLAFGWASARLDDLMNLVPARLAALLLSFAAFFVPQAAPWRALLTTWRDSGKHRSPNSGWPEAAMAGALGLALSGPRRYPGQQVEGEWIGNGRQDANAQDIGRALRVYVTACLIGAGVVMILWLRHG